MTQLVFSVRDGAAEQWIDPFFAPTIAIALRGFAQACTREEHGFKKFPEDFVLYQVGKWDATKGEIRGIDPHKVASALDYVVHANQQEIELDG